MPESLVQLKDIAASDIILLGKELNRKNLESTEVIVDIYTDHMTIRDKNYFLLSWTKRSAPAPTS